MGKRIFTLFVMLAFVFTPVPAMAQEKYDMNSPEFKEISSQFVCPECETVSADLNDRFKEEILELMNAGYTNEEIKAHFVDMYGEEVLAAPEKSGFSLLAWVTPFVALVVASGVIIFIIRKSVRKTAQNSGADDTAPILANGAQADVIQSLIEEERKRKF